MRLVVLFLTISLVLSFILQWLRPKGTRAHIARGIWMIISTILIVLINTVSIEIRWDTPFILHTSLGSIGFLLLLGTCVYGSKTLKDKEYKIFHKNLAYAAALFFILSLLAAVTIRFLR